MTKRRSIPAILALIILAPIGNCLAQNGNTPISIKGFNSYTAFEIVELATPFKVDRIEGSVSFHEEALANVLVEIRDSKNRIRATRTDTLGRFKFRKLVKGSYAFKTTLNGFSSVVGTFIVDSGNNNPDSVKITMPIGV